MFFLLHGLSTRSSSYYFPFLPFCSSSFQVRGRLCVSVCWLWMLTFIRIEIGYWMMLPVTCRTNCFLSYFFFFFFCIALCWVFHTNFDVSRISLESCLQYFWLMEGVCAMNNGENKLTWSQVPGGWKKKSLLFSIYIYISLCRKHYCDVLVSVSLINLSRKISNLKCHLNWVS